MKDDKDMFFQGKTHGPQPHNLGPAGLLFASKPSGLWGSKPFKNISISSFAFMFIFLFSISPSYADTTAPQVCHQGDCVALEVVSKDADLERGLMYRKSLDANKGMFFVFNKDDIYQFWMKNMQFNLDILWISLDGHIVFIGQDIPACVKDPCPVYSPDKRARYVLEINSGYTASHHWKLGDKLDLKGI
jgi:uncharacterized membrane protein (UPF0127 family)